MVLAAFGAVASLTAHPVLHADDAALEHHECFLCQAAGSVDATPINLAAILVAHPVTQYVILPQSDAPLARDAFDQVRIPRGPPSRLV